MSSPLNKPVKITWEVKDFANLIYTQYGPSFTLPTNSKVAFDLRCYVNYKCAYYVSGFQSTTIYLCLNSSNKDQVSVRYRISILNANGDKCETHEGRANCCLEPSNQRCYALCQLKHDYLMNPANGLLVDGKLIIDCEVSEENAKLAGPGDAFSNSQICEDFESLLESAKFSDAALIVGEKELLVHKNILSARSKVFASMFEHDCKEKRQNRVEITDVSVEMCKLMLRYIYTGKIPEMTQMSEYATELFVAADKYQLDHLKVVCEQYLGTSLGIESVVSTLLLADMHSATLLKPKCMDYIVHHAKEVVATDGWKHLAKSRPDLGTLLFEAIANKK